jgi:hypothetical protein
MPIEHRVHGADGGQENIAATSPQLLTEFRGAPAGMLSLELNNQRLDLER